MDAKKAKAKKEREELGVDSAEMENVMDHARDMFQKYDADCGGSIDADEFTALCYDMGSEPQHTLAMYSACIPARRVYEYERG